MTCENTMHDSYDNLMTYKEATVQEWRKELEELKSKLTAAKEERDGVRYDLDDLYVRNAAFEVYDSLQMELVRLELVVEGLEFYCERLAGLIYDYRKRTN